MASMLGSRMPFVWQRKHDDIPFRGWLNVAPALQQTGEDLVELVMTLDDADLRRFARWCSPKYRAKLRQLHHAYRLRRHAKW